MQCRHMQGDTNVRREGRERDQVGRALDCTASLSLRVLAGSWELPDLVRDYCVTNNSIFNALTFFISGFLWVRNSGAA